MLLLYLQEYDPAELRQLAALCRDAASFDWETRVAAAAETPAALLTQVKPGDSPALFFLDDEQPEELREAVARIRELNALHYLVLLLYSAEDALRVRPPFYRPTGFLLRPVSRDAIYRLLESVYCDFTAASPESGEVFQVRVRGTVYPLPYSRILCFESSGKKIIARTNAQEYDFYGSLEEISCGAPGYFLRIHKSFCVNMKEVRTVSFSERTVTLSDETVLPFSRTFKPELAKALGHAAAK